MSQCSVPRSYGQTDPHGIQPRPVSELRTSHSRRQSCVLVTPPPADAYRGLFKFGVLNAIQSTCFDTVSFPVAPAASRVLTLCQVDAHTAEFGKVDLPLISVTDPTIQVVSCQLVHSPARACSDAYSQLPREAESPCFLNLL